MTTTASPTLQDLTTINYTLSWPYLHHPSNTTFAGPTQLALCKCNPPAHGPNPNDLGHLYTRYRCALPRVSFTSPDDDDNNNNNTLWVLQTPLGHINLLRPATSQELRRRQQLHNAHKPTAYAGKNFLLLSGPCPRGRYQAYATQCFIGSLPPAAREHIECLSLLIQPYEEDCSDDQGSRAYAMLARCIVDRLPGFKTLCLNIWGQGARLGTREFALVLWRPGVRIVVSWDWASEVVEEYTDVEGFLKGVEEGVVVARSVWERRVRDAGGVGVGVAHGHGRDDVAHSTWEEVVTAEADDDEIEAHGGLARSHEGRNVDLGAGGAVEGGVEIISDSDEWSDAMLTPVTPKSAKSG